MRVGIIGGSIAGCAAAALLHQAGHDVTVIERSESGLVSRGAGILILTAAWQDITARGIVDGTVPGCRVGYSRFVTRAARTGQPRWLGDVQMSSMLFNWAHLYQSLRRRVPDDLYRNGAAVERIEATPHGTTLHLAGGGSPDFDLVVCADGYRSLGRGLIDPGAAPAYRGIVLWRGLLPERDIRADALAGCDLLRPVYQGGHGVAYYVPGPGQSIEPGERLLMWGYYLQVPESDLASVLIDDQERQQSGSVPFGKVHPDVRAALESRLAGLLPSPLFDLVQQSGNSSIQAIYSFVARSYARDRLCLVGDSGTLSPPFAGSGVLRAVTSAASLADALAAAPTVDDALRQWSDAQLQAAAQIIPNAEGIERNYVFGMPDLSSMPITATNDWMSAAYTGLPVTLPAATGNGSRLDQA
jgi:2-polyprenyl-6-methoxyphenol hydroxylase-like FAD-dependent oxidoreductase